MNSSIKKEDKKINIPPIGLRIIKTGIAVFYATLYQFFVVNKDMFFTHK